MSIIFDWKKEINKQELNICIETIKKDGIMVFPTETVYGIGANALSEKAIQKIFKAKGRPNDNPLIVHVSDIQMLYALVENINDVERKLINYFMPGPFTLILKKKEKIPNVVTANKDTVGIRMPSNKIANILIKSIGLPIAAPSANISGKPSGTRIEDIKDELKDKVDVIINGGLSDIGIESTVVKVIDNIPVILRPGKVTFEEIKSKIGKCKLSPQLSKKIEKGEIVESPGMKYRHYAPETKSILIYEKDEQNQIKKINKLIEENNNVCIIGFKEHKSKIHSKIFIELGSKDKLEEVSKKIFSSLRKADRLGVDLIIIEGLEEKQIGLAIMNRLRRACEIM